MGTPIAIIVGAALIAAAILVTGHWQIIPPTGDLGAAVVLRLDRWTGTIEICMVDAKTIPNGPSMAGTQLPCRP
jgi:hypothetical protein